MSASRTAAASAEARNSPSRARGAVRRRLSSCGPPSSSAAVTTITWRDAGAGHLFEHAHQRGRPIGEPMRFAAPVTLRRKSNQLRVGRHRQGEGAGHRVEHVVARRAGQVHGFGGSTVEPGGLPPQEERPPPVAAQQRKHQVLPGVEVVGDNQQFAKPRLAQVVGQQLRVPPAQVRARGLRDAGAAAQQIPQPGDEVVDGGRRGERCAEHRPPHAAPQVASGRRHGARAQRGHGDGEHDDGEHRRHNLRDTGWQPVGCEGHQAHRLPLLRQPRAGAAADHVEQDRDLVHRRAQRQHQRRHDEHGGRQGQSATTRRSAVRHGYRPPHGRTAPQARGLPQPRRAVDGGKQRRHRAHAASRDQIDADAGLVQRADGAGVIRAVDAAAREHQRSSPVGCVLG